MAQKLNATCKICGKPYHYCKDCEKFGSWRAVACSPECWVEWVNRVTGKISEEETEEKPKNPQEKTASPKIKWEKAEENPAEDSEKAEK